MNVGAVEVLENYYIHNLPNGCAGQDRNPHYHQITDTIDKMYLPAAFDIHRAGLGTLAGLAGPLGRCFDSPPQVQAAKTSSGIQLTWDALPEAGNYRIYRATNGCDGTFQRVAETSEPGWLDTSAVSYTHLRAHETVLDLVCRLLLEKKKKKTQHILTSAQLTT